MSSRVRHLAIACGGVVFAAAMAIALVAPFLLDAAVRAGKSAPCTGADFLSCVTANGLCVWDARALRCSASAPGTLLTRSIVYYPGVLVHMDSAGRMGMRRITRRSEPRDARFFAETAFAAVVVASCVCAIAGTSVLGRRCTPGGLFRAHTCGLLLLCGGTAVVLAAAAGITGAVLLTGPWDGNASTCAGAPSASACLDASRCCAWSHNTSSCTSVPPGTTLGENVHGVSLFTLDGVPMIASRLLPECRDTFAPVRLPFAVTWGAAATLVVLEAFMCAKAATRAADR